MNEFDCLAEAMRRKGVPEESVQKCLRSCRLQGLTPEEIAPGKEEEYIAALTAARERCQTDLKFRRSIFKAAELACATFQSKN